ncbi:hypothetical protein ACQJBY_070710 [Aegilops geniculata]
MEEGIYLSSGSHAARVRDHPFCLLPRRLHQRPALRRCRVPQRRQQVLPPAQPDGVVARAGGPVHEQPPRVAGVGAAPEDAGARRGGLRPGAVGIIALVVPVAVGVGHRAGEERREADHHAVRPHVAAGRHERRDLGPVRRPVERPRALPGALLGRVAHPQVGVPRPAVRAGGGVVVNAAPGHAEGRHEDVGRREHGGDGAAVVPRAPRQRRDVLQREGPAQRHALVEELSDEPQPRAPAAVQRDGAPPGRHGRLGGAARGRRRDRAHEVGDDGALRRCEAAVVEDVDLDGEVPREQRAAVVPEHDRVGLHQEQRPRAVRRAPRRRGDEEGEEAEQWQQRRHLAVAHGMQEDQRSS